VNEAQQEMPHAAGNPRHVRFTCVNALTHIIVVSRRVRERRFVAAATPRRSLIRAVPQPGSSARKPRLNSAHWRAGMAYTGTTPRYAQPKNGNAECHGVRRPPFQTVS